MAGRGDERQEATMASATPLEIPNARPAGEPSLYMGAALAAIAIAFAGFAPTYYLKGVLDGPELSTLKHVHGIVMTAWLALFLVQARLVATGKVAMHRRLGVAGIVLAALVVGVTMATAIASARAGATPLPSIPPLAFLILPTSGIVVFATLFVAAIAMRRRAAWHKRLMLVASLSLIVPALARLPLVRDGGPPAFFGLVDLMLIGCIAFDAARNRRVHPALLAGLGVVIAGQVAPLLLAKTPAWMAVARWLVD
jgi:hypothetical protein